MSPIPLSVRFTIVLLLFVFAGQGQKSFIGSSEKKVVRYWKDKEPSARFEHVKDTVARTSVFSVIKNDSTEFHAEFENGKCVRNNYKISDSQSKVFYAQLKKLGYIWDEGTRRWYNSKRKAQWMVEPLRGGLYMMSAIPIVPK